MDFRLFDWGRALKSRGFIPVAVYLNSNIGICDLGSQQFCPRLKAWSSLFSERVRPELLYLASKPPRRRHDCLNYPIPCV